MNRNQKRIEKSLIEKGHKMVKALWEPVGGNVEMIGREGGWTVEIDGSPFANDYIFGYSVNEVIENINKLPSNF